MDVERLRADLAAALPQGPLIVTGGVLVAEADGAAAAEALGVERVLAIGIGRGTGPLAETARTELHVVDPGPSATLMEAMRRTASLLADPPAEMVELIDAFDPAGEAWVLLDPTSRQPTLCGRPVFGIRRPEWWALEDKTTNDALFTDAGVTTAPSRIVAPADAATAAAELDDGAGTVWSGDALEGFNGGGEYVRVVDDDASAAEATEFFGGRVERLRIAPFLEGLPCSIHGLVLDGSVVTFRPIELVNFRVAGRSQLLFAGVGEGWVAPHDVATELKSVARRVGAHLASSVGYRGAFGVDGVLTPDGFRPTELNPRLSGGFFRIQRSVAEVPLRLLDAAVRAGTLTLADADEFERWAVDRLRDAVHPRLGMPVPRRFEDEQTRWFARDDAGRWSLTDDEAAASAVVTIGPAAMGGFMRVDATDRWVHDGSPVRGDAAALIGLIDAEYDLGLGRILA